MSDLYRTLRTRERLRHIFAAAFVLFFLAEWGAHVMIHTNSHSRESHAIIETDPPSRAALSVHCDHEAGDEPCHTATHCRDGRHRDRQVPNLGHDLTPIVLIDLLSDVDLEINLQAYSPMPFTGADGLSRPPDPAFHPPELS